MQNQKTRDQRNRSLQGTGDKNGEKKINNEKGKRIHFWCPLKKKKSGGRADGEKRTNPTKEPSEGVPPVFQKPNLEKEEPHQKKKPDN